MRYQHCFVQGVSSRSIIDQVFEVGIIHGEKASFRYWLRVSLGWKTNAILKYRWGTLYLRPLIFIYIKLYVCDDNMESDVEREGKR